MIYLPKIKKILKVETSKSDRNLPRSWIFLADSQKNKLINEWLEMIDSGGN